MMPCFHFAFSLRMLWASFAFLLLRLFWTDLPRFPPGFFEDNLFHEACRHWVTSRDLSPVFGGLFCANSLSDNSTLSVLFQQTGLYHLLVVSGAHLIFLEKILDTVLKERPKIKITLFFIFTLICQMNPPITRAFIGQILRFLSIKKCLFLNEETRILLSGIWCLILFPDWILSTSLMLSWMASLALNYQIAGWKKHFIIALYLLPWTQTLSFSSIFNNLLFSYLFEWVLFPLSFMCFVIPGLTQLGNSTWRITEYLMSHLPITFATIEPTDPIKFWPYLFTFHLFHRLKR